MIACSLPEIPGQLAGVGELHNVLGFRNIEDMVIRLSDEKKPPGPKREGDRQTGLVLDERTRTKKPPMYKVLLHNDDYTTREFVVWVLQTVFHKNETDAIAIMSHVHNHGLGVAGVYTFEVAETKVTKTMALAKAQQFPLQLSIEPTD
jgi:ATP-dependent Clp protease adaptor protein ClpS